MAESTSSNPESPQFLKFREVVNNVIMSRTQLIKQLFDPRRDIDRECGYPDQNTAISLEQYQTLYNRNSIGARVVEVHAKAAWQSTPSIYEDENPEVSTVFEQAWLGLNKQLRPNSFYRTEVGSLVWDVLKRADILSGIGRYGVVFLGLNDGKDPEQPAVPNPNNKLTFLRAYPEYFAPISEFETRKGSPRYGQATYYDISIGDPNDYSAGSNVRLDNQRVHWSRVVHICDNMFSEVYGIPRMQQVINHLLDLYKLYGGSAEMYWRGAFPGIMFKTHPSLGGDVMMDEAAMKDKAEEYMNGLQRFMILMGMDAESLAPQVVDPSPQIMRQIEAICIKIDCPLPVFMGSEAGKEAAAQNDASWNDTVKERRNNYMIPRLIAPFVDHLIGLQVLPEPKEYTAAWPDLVSKTDAQRASISMIRSQAIAQYVKSEGWKVMTPLDFLVSVLGYTEKESLKMWSRTEKFKLTQQTEEINNQRRVMELQVELGVNVQKPSANGSSRNRGASGSNRELPSVKPDKRLGA